MDEDLSNSIFAEVESSGFDMIEVRPAGADDVAEEYDAYYGSSSPLVPAFSVKHKPVMIADFEINY